MSRTVALLAVAVRLPVVAIKADAAPRLNAMFSDRRGPRSSSGVGRALHDVLVLTKNVEDTPVTLARTIRHGFPSPYDCWA